MIKNLLNADDDTARSEASADPVRSSPLSLFGDEARASDHPVADAPNDERWFEEFPQIAKPGRADVENDPFDREPSIVISHFRPPTTAESVRRSGLAWSAGVVFFGSVVFTLILGWFADLLLGTSPWGIVAGIILGSIIAFINFFRITGQIFKGG